MFVSSAGLRQRPGARSPDHSAFSVPELSSKDKVARVVYPPCDTDRLAALPLEMRENIILSVAQFRFEDFLSLFSLSLTYTSPFSDSQTGERAAHSA